MLPFASCFRKGYNMDMKIEEILKERIKDNKELFTQEEIDDIISNDTYTKIYLLGMLDAKKM